MNSKMQKRALAAREAHIALLDLKKAIEEAAHTVQDAEFEAAHLAIGRRTDGDITPKVRQVLDRLACFEATLVRARESLQLAMS